MSYTMQSRVAGDFDQAVETTMAALGDEGFGVLCDVDVQATFEQKLDEEFRQYRILGACNPALARDGLAEELELGALLPCNVVVYEGDDGDVVVSAIDPVHLLGVADNEALGSIATDVRDRFERVLAAVADDLGSVPEA